MQREKFINGLNSGIKFTDDVYICLKYIEKVFEIHPDQILKAIDVKLLREKGRLDE